MNRPRQLKKLLSSSVKKLSFICAALLIATIQTLMIFVSAPKSAAAAVPPEQYKGMELAAAYSKCFNATGFADRIPKELLASRYILGGGGDPAQMISSNKTKINVSQVVGAGGSMECGSMVISLLNSLGVNYENDFVDKFYYKIDDNNDGEYNDWGMKSGVTSGTIKNWFNEKFKEKGWLSGSSFVVEIPYVKMAVTPAFNECFEKLSNTISADIEYGGIGYKVKDSGKNVSVGLIVDKYEGQWTCGELKMFLQYEGDFNTTNARLIEIILGNASQEEEEQQNQEAKINKIKEVFDGNIATLNNCIAAVSPVFAGTTTDYKKETMAKWLAAGGTGPITISPGGGGSQTISAENAAIIGKCLNDEYGPELAEAVATELDFSPPNESSDGQGDSCYDDVEPLFEVGPIKVPNPLKWAVCGIGQLLAGFINTATTVVQGLLKYDPTEGTGSGDTKIVWANILRVSNIIFVAAFLIMVLSTVLDLGIFSSYTVKKLLPRIIIAAILANLSWAICSTLILIVNEVAEGVRELILSPFGGNGSTELSQAVVGIMNDPPGAGGSSLALSGVATVAIGALLYQIFATAGAVLIPILLTVGMAIIVTLFTLLARRIIIVLLIVFAPLAFALWALPGGDKWVQRWWKTFMQMLLIYPLTMALFASGVFLSNLVDGGQLEAGIATAFVSVIILFLPFFALPFLFKAASSTLSNVTGMINDKSKGLVDRGRNWGREKGQNTNFNLARKASKDEKQRVRADRQHGVGLHNLQHKIEKGKGIRSWAARRGLDKEDIDIVKADAAEHSVRRQSAEEKSRRAQRTGHTLDIQDLVRRRQEELAVDKDGVPGMSAAKARETALDEIAAKATEIDDNGNFVAGEQEYFAIMQELGRQKSDKHIGRVQEGLAQQGRKGADRWNAGVADNDVFGATTALNKGFGQSINAGMTHNEVASLRLDTAMSKNIEARAGDTKGAWKESVHAAANYVPTNANDEVFIQKHIETQTAAGVGVMEATKSAHTALRQQKVNEVFADFDAIDGNENLRGALNLSRKDLEETVHSATTPDPTTGELGGSSYEPPKPQTPTP